MKNIFSLKQDLRIAWSLTKEHIIVMLGLSFLILLISLTFTALSTVYPFPLAVSFIGLLSSILVFLLRMGYVRVALDATNGIVPSFSAFVDSSKMFFSYFFASLLLSAIVFVGTLLLIVPGIYLAVRFNFALFIVLEGERNPIEAMRRSWQITEGHVWDILALTGLLILINTLGILCFVVGVFVTAVLSLFAYTEAYRILQRSHESKRTHMDTMMVEN